MKNNRDPKYVISCYGLKEAIFLEQENYQELSKLYPEYSYFLSSNQKFSNALEVLSKQCKVFEYLGDMLQLINTYGNIAATMCALECFKEAKEYLDQMELVATANAIDLPDGYVQLKETIETNL